jgi:formate-dependent nitrite reductase cytochrome c552 subunit
VSHLSRYEEFKQYLRELKSHPCMDCGHCYPPDVMQFDHVRGEKVNKISSMYKYSWEKIDDEVAKCDLVCANCHTMRTTRRGRNWPPRGPNRGSKDLNTWRYI